MACASQLEETPDSEVAVLDLAFNSSISRKFSKEHGH
jgi:hypothetical protein